MFSIGPDNPGPISCTVFAKKLWNATGIFLENGRSYEIRVVPPEQTWTDWMIPSDADGYTRCYMEPFEFLRRVPNEKWFALIGAIGRDPNTFFKIGQSARYSPQTSGELTCFANDAAFAYWNNCGSLTLEVTMTP